MQKIIEKLKGKKTRKTQEFSEKLQNEEKLEPTKKQFYYVKTFYNSQ